MNPLRGKYELDLWALYKYAQDNELSIKDRIGFLGEAGAVIDLYVDDIEPYTPPRYFVDIRGGCGAVRDRFHESYDEGYPGLHSDTPDVVEYRHGYINEGIWNMTQEDVSQLNDLCNRLNKQPKYAQKN
jgi:hypothetical protein